MLALATALLCAFQDPTPESVRRDIDRLRPAKLAWGEIPWIECPLEALRRAREEKKPVIVWVFLGNPSNERC